MNFFSKKTTLNVIPNLFRNLFALTKILNQVQHDKLLISIFFLMSLSAFALDPSADEYSAKPVSVTASNTLIEDAPDKYAAANLIDNTYKSWAGKGVGTEFVFDFKSEIEIYGIAIRNGYGSLGYYLKNNRVKSIKIASEKQELGSYPLPDSPDPHCISYLDHPISAKQIKIVITEIYKGTEFDDTCISEITFLDNPNYCYDSYREKEFKYDAWRGRLFAEIYKAHSKKTRIDAFGRCQAYTTTDFEDDNPSWVTIPEHLHNDIYPVGYRGMNKNYGIFLTKTGAAVVEWERDDLTDVDLHFYIYDGKSLTSADANPAFKKIADAMNEIVITKLCNLRFWSHENTLELQYTKYFYEESNESVEGHLKFNFDGSKFVNVYEKKKHSWK